LASLVSAVVIIMPHWQILTANITGAAEDVLRVSSGAETLPKWSAARHKYLVNTGQNKH
jgi:hypothetical protein